MIDILALFQCLQPLLAATTLKQFSLIAFAMLVMTGRVTMLGMSRWAGKGGSYRTVQRFFYTKAVPLGSFVLGILPAPSAPLRS
jgi:putative transposase